MINFELFRNLISFLVFLKLQIIIKMKFIKSLAFLLLFSDFAFAQNLKPFLLVGTYDSAKSDGIYVYKFDEQTGNADFVSSVSSSNPSYLSISPDQKNVYAVNENSNADNNGGGVSAFSFNRSKGELRLINQEKTGGNDPCYIDEAPYAKWLAVANYSGGSVSILPVLENGDLGKLRSTIQYSGKGFNPERQEAPHAHAAVFSKDGRILAVTDLGLDKIILYPFDQNSGEIDSDKAIVTNLKPGAGPRHVVFHPTNHLIYVVEELSASVSVFKIKGEKLVQVQNLEMLQPDQMKGNTGADIHISDDGQFLYTSLRGTINEIRIFKVKNNGKLKAIGVQDTKGVNPRNFSLSPSGNFLLVGNQSSDEIHIFKRNAKTGLLTDIQKKINLGKPVCLKWIE